MPNKNDRLNKNPNRKDPIFWLIAFIVLIVFAVLFLLSAAYEWSAVKKEPSIKVASHVVPKIREETWRLKVDRQIEEDAEEIRCYGKTKIIKEKGVWRNAGSC